MKESSFFVYGLGFKAKLRASDVRVYRAYGLEVRVVSSTATPLST